MTARSAAQEEVVSRRRVSVLCGSGLPRGEIIQECVFTSTDYRHWGAAQRAVADYIPHRNGRDHDCRIAALKRQHRVAA